MEFKYAWLEDPTIFAINRLPAHSDHTWYIDEKDFVNGTQSNALKLNGKWKFHYAKNWQGTIDGFEALTCDCQSWDDIEVPGHIQMQGYGTPVYVNTMYPWTAREQLDIGEIPEHENPIGSYVKYFDLPNDFVGRALHLTFDGVETAFAIYMNGIFVGYSEDSFTPSHFDVTPYVVAGRNKLAVQVFRYSSASWLEDQDFWRFSGIFRDVTLYALPDVHVYDLSVVSDLYENYTKAHIGIDLSFLKASKGEVGAIILDADGDVVVSKSIDFEEAKVSFEMNINEDLHLWSAEDPYLYQVILYVYDEHGNIAEIVSSLLGLREFAISKGIMYLNGQRIVFNGVNRHEFSMVSGRVVGDELIYQDLLIMKQNNINAVRTSHYPNQTSFYQMCDMLGLYVIDETNLETHGTWQVAKDCFNLDKVLPNDHPKFRHAVLDRARSMYERDKNHPSILIWSCGNESYGGETLFEMSEYFREVDPRRIVHYEGVFNDRRNNQISDIESQMYTPADKVAQYLDEHDDKPFILCEYAHAMGNSNGALHKYTDLVDLYPQYQGGFIWDFVNQAILKNGKLHYGGDFQERPSDFDFCGNGIVFADRSLTPKMQEVKYCYQPISFSFEEDVLVIKNRHLFTNLNVYDLRFSLAYEGKVIAEFSDVIDCQPQASVTVALPFLEEMTAFGEYTITVSALLHEDTIYAQAGYEVAFDQVVYATAKKEVSATKINALRISYDGFNVGAVGENFHVFFNMKGLTDYTYASKAYLHGRIARPNFFRPATQNDTANQYGFRYGRWQSASLYQQIIYQGYRTDENRTYLEVMYKHILWPDDESYVDVVYRVDSFGAVEIDMTLHPSEKTIEAPEFGYMMSMPLDFEEVTYYGYGPEENYVDRIHGARLGIFSYDIDDNFTPYLMPQECGNRCGVRKAWISDGQNHVLEITSDVCELSVLRYLPNEIDNATHVDELPIPYQTVVRINAMQMGIAGDNTWGAKTHDEYLLPKNEELHFRFKIKGY